jgi:hypothetical protein
MKGGDDDVLKLVNARDGRSQVLHERAERFFRRIFLRIVLENLRFWGGGVSQQKTESDGHRKMCTMSPQLEKETRLYYALDPW